MGLHPIFDGTTPHLPLMSVEDNATNQPPTSEPSEPDQPLPPWLDISFLNRLDAINGVAPPGEQHHPLSIPGTDAAISESIATFAHEVRTPLSTMHATLEVLSDDRPIDPDDLQQLVSRLQRGVTWITELVEHLSTAAQDNPYGITLNLAPASVHDWIEEAIALVQPLADLRQQSILFACPRPAPVVRGDHLRLGQVMVNLLTNACRYGAWADTIAVSVSADHDWVTIRVADHGSGVRPDEQQRIFERRERGTQPGGRYIDGQGLGLHIVREIVERHNGTIGVESAVGKGATFVVRLPAMRCVRPLIVRHAVNVEGEIAE